MVEQGFFRGLPAGKKEGICQTGPDSGSEVVVIDKNCINCKIGYCMMFKAVYDQEGKIIGREFINNPPAYKTQG